MTSDRLSPNAKQVFWFNDGKTPNVADFLEKKPEISMHRLEYGVPEAENWPVIEASHVYCVTSARDELPVRFKPTGAFLKRCPNLLVVSTSGAGYDTVDVDACTRAGVIVVNQTGANAEAVATHAVGLVLALTKKLFESDRSLRKERGVNRETFKGWETRGKTIGLVGLGNIGRRVARICGLGLEMKVLAYDPYIADADFKERGAEKCSLDDLLKASDYVSLHCPYNDETNDMIGSRELGLMKSGAFIVNCARGGITNEDALAKALSENRIAGAALDVWVNEPPPMDHPLFAFDNFIATFHTAGLTVESRINMAAWNAEQICAIFEGGRPLRLINPEAWGEFTRRYKKIFGTSVKV